MKELLEIQKSLKCDKGQWNDFGKYKFRSLENILNDIKPILVKLNCTVTFTDELVLVGNRYYIKSTVTIKNDNGESDSSIGWAREQEQKKGMDEAQITGSASSFARKYAICSLCAISDGFDLDILDNSEEGNRDNFKAATLEVSLKQIENAKSRATLNAIYNRDKCYSEEGETPNYKWITALQNKAKEFPKQPQNNN